MLSNKEIQEDNEQQIRELYRKEIVDNFETKDSGQREEPVTTIKSTEEKESFKTGSMRNSRVGKGRYDLIPPFPLKLLAIHYEEGSKLYSDRNWEKGQNLSRYIDSCKRHINCFEDGMRDEPHLVAAVWNLFAYLHTEEMIKRGILSQELDDIPKESIEYHQKRSQS